MSMSADQLLETQWRSAWDDPAATDAVRTLGALDRAALLFEPSTLPSTIKTTLLDMLAQSCDWTQVNPPWFAFGNHIGPLCWGDRSFMDALAQAGISPRIALDHALMMGTAPRKGWRQGQYQLIQRWEPRLRKPLTQISNMASELILLWAGEHKQQQWLSLLTADQELNQGRLQLLSTAPDNLNALLGFIFEDRPLRDTQLATTVLPEGLAP